MDLHYSQTYEEEQVKEAMFESPMDLHYSQTMGEYDIVSNCLNPLWIYTTLKPFVDVKNKLHGLNPLWIYTTLKPKSQPYHLGWV